MVSDDTLKKKMPSFPAIKGRTLSDGVDRNTGFSGVKTPSGVASEGIDRNTGFSGVSAGYIIDN